ncbi:MAG: DUF899 family protein [Armatimonadetes bacterium]|nr:DUF899 family protein [Armatimonadota bacterium]
MDQVIIDKMKAISALKKELLELRKQRTPDVVGEFTLETPEGPKSISDLFGDKNDLIVIHNMGESCPYCTLWADGLNAFVPRFAERTAFVLVSPDPLEQQKALKAQRGWNFEMASDTSREFTTAMGYYTEDNGYWPGYSTFYRAEDGTITRVGADFFGPNDDYCAVWPMMDLLKDGVNDWEPHN